MKKHLLLFLALAVTTLSSHAQTDAINIIPSGNVGIGSTAPVQKLDVQGNIKLDDNMMVEGTPTSRIYRNLVSYAHELGSSPGIFIIHTNQPFATDCMFRVKIEGYFYDASATFETTVAAYNYNGGSTFLNKGYTNIGAKNLPVRLGRNASGNIAIILGTDGASYSHPHLSVTSYHQSYGGISEAYADGWTITRATDASALTLVTTVPDVTTLPTGSGNYIQNQFASAQSSNYWISGDARIQGNTYIGPNANKYFYPSADRIIVAAESTTDVAEFASYGLYLPKTNAYNLYVGGGAQFAYGTAGYIDFRNEGGISTNSGTLNMYFKNTGRTGVGTTSPNFKLDIQQDITMDGDITPDKAQLSVGGLTTPGKRMIIGYDITGNGFGFIKAGNYGVTWTPLALQPNGGSVGIGTTAPGTKLDVVGGSIRTDNQLISTVATGTSPLAVTSTTLNTNLNADRLDNYHASELQFQQSNRDFPNGTLIQTDIDYSVTNGEPWLLEIEGNSYGNLVPVDIKVQGYIYNNTVINYGGISNGTNITGLSLFNYNGKLCFWFPSQGYWNGYNVFVNDSYAGVKHNRLVSITHEGIPGSRTKEVALSSSIRQSVHSGNYTSYGDNLGNHTATTTLNMNGNIINNYAKLEPYGIGGNSGQGTHAYAIYQEGGAWTDPYPDLRIAFHTGIKFGANSGYQGMRFYTDYDMSSLVMSVNDGSTGGASNVYMAGSLGIGAAPPATKLHVAGGGAIIGTTSSGSNNRTLTILNNGQAQISFGAYPWEWSPAFQLQNNDNTKFVWLSAGGSGAYSGYDPRLMVAGGGLDIYTNATSSANGTYIAKFVANGSVGTLNMGTMNDPSGDQGNNWITWGYRSDNNPYYCMRTQYKTYGSNTLSRLQLNWHTGIEIGANSSYGGTRFFTEAPGIGGSQIFSVGDGSSNVVAEAQGHFKGGLKTQKTYYAFEIDVYPNTTRYDNLGEWDFCALTRKYVYVDMDDDSDTNFDCQVYISSGGGTMAYNTKPNWYLLSQAINDVRQVNCRAQCFNLE
jgi:hypothetical protein